MAKKNEEKETKVVEEVKKEATKVEEVKEEKQEKKPEIKYRGTCI